VKKEKVKTAVLSTTAKVKARTDRKKQADGVDVEMTEDNNNQAASRRKKSADQPAAENASKE
jgi:hypothetical protein